MDTQTAGAHVLHLLAGRALTDLMRATGWSHAELARAMWSDTRRLSPKPTERLVREWEQREHLGYPLSVCVYDTAAEEKLRWRAGRWISVQSVRLKGSEVAALRAKLGWTQARLARELDTSQQTIAKWESNADKRLSGVASCAVRGIERSHR